jgi:hypothetical protein
MKKLLIVLTSICLVFFLFFMDQITGVLYFVAISGAGFWVLLYGFFRGTSQGSKDALLFCATPILSIIVAVIGYLIGSPIYENICENSAEKIAKQVELYHTTHHCYPEKLANVQTAPFYINNYLYSKISCDNIVLHCTTTGKYYDTASKVWHEKSSGVRLEDFLLIPH